MPGNPEQYEPIYEEWGKEGTSPSHPTGKNIIRKPRFGEGPRFMFTYQYGTYSSVHVELQASNDTQAEAP
jgi:hypothetical protein